MERKAYTAFGETGFGETGRHRCKRFIFPCPTSRLPEQLAHIEIKKLRHCHCLMFVYIYFMT